MNASQMLPDENGKLVKTPVHKFFGKEWAHTIGTAYGYIVNKFQMTQQLIDKIKNHPEDRRMVMTLWQNDYLDTAVLPSCVWSSEWDVTDGKLNCWVHQRSCDVPLGLPFNVTQYATLLCMLAQVCGLKPAQWTGVLKTLIFMLTKLTELRNSLKDLTSRAICLRRSFGSIPKLTISLSLTIQEIATTLSLLIINTWAKSNSLFRSKSRRSV